MQKRPVALILENAIAALDRAIEMTETLLAEYRQSRYKLQRELADLTPTEATEAFRRASQELERVKK